jgi:sterol desaturase/sphingolipid hydroxylase (fatty acid hydroxylase superfamily)
MEAAVRAAIFLSIFAAVAVAEWRAPKRAQSRRERWRINLSILLVDVVAQRLTLGAAAYGAAILAQERGWGLFNVLGWPPVFEGVIAFLILDLAVYGQHVASHAVPVFWRLHQVHHADLEVDVTTGIRFHPLEILASLLWKVAVVLAIGADPWVVVAFEAVLNASSVYTHGNVRVPERWDRALRAVFCTPDMHRIHHSVVRRETDSNYGFFLSVWDRLFGTYRADPEAGHDRMEIGLAEYRDPARLGLVALIAMPFRRLARGNARDR